MGKRGWALLLAVLALLLTFPTPVLAQDHPSPPRTTHFKGQARVFVAGIQEVQVLNLKPLRLRFVGEVVQGQVVDSSWEALKGASFQSTHTSEVTFLPGGTFAGNLTGDFHMVSTSGDLHGTMKAVVKGKWVPGSDGMPVIIEKAHDLGQWQASGTLAAQASGTFKARLIPQGPTLAGALDINGVYR